MQPFLVFSDLRDAMQSGKGRARTVCGLVRITTALM